MKAIIVVPISVCLYASTILSVSGQVAVVYRTVPPALIQDHLKAEYRFTEGTGQEVLNRLGSGLRNPNLLTASEQSFVDRWSLVGFTATEQYAANPINSDVTATRAVASVAGSRISAGGISLAPGTYTHSIYMKSNTGSSQTVRFSYFDGTTRFSPDQTVTTTWTRFTWTFTSLATMLVFSCVSMDAANDSLDLVIYGAQLELASSATAYTPASLNFVLGNYGSSDTSDPTWDTVGLNFNSANSQYGFAIKSSPITFSQASVYLVFKQTGDGNFATYAPGIGVDFSLGGQFNLNPRHNGATSFVFSGALSNAYAAYVNDSQWHVLAGTYDGSTLSTYVDDQVLSEVSSPGLSSVSVRKLFLGLYGVTYLKGGIAAAAIYDIGHNVTQVKQNVSNYQAIMACRGIMMTNLKQLIVYEGDSITDPTAFYGGPSYWAVTQSSLSPSIQGRDFAQSGNTIAQLNTRASQIDAMFDTPRQCKILSVAIGTNDLSTDSAATYLANLQAYCLARKAAHPDLKIVVYTVLPRQNSATFESRRQTARTTMLADPNWTNGTYANAIGDWGADPTIGCAGCESNTTYWQVDQTHPNGLGHAIMATYSTPAIQSVRPQ